MPNPSLYKQRDTAEQIRQQYATQVAQVNENRDLSEGGRKRRLAEIYVATKTKLDELATAEVQNLHSRKTSLERELFGARGVARGLDAGALAISARDASDRAAQLQSPAEAAELLARAEADGDELLARAVARRCIQGSEAAMTSSAAGEWDQVTRVYLDSRPNLEPVVEELAEIETLTTRQVFSPFSVLQPNGVEREFINTAAGVDHSAQFSDSLRGA
jgi:hypothetical protein